jgi:hypothetical protein
VTRTRPITLILWGVFGAAAGWLLELALVATGSPQVIPPITLGLVLAVIGAIVLGMAVPIRRAVKDRDPQRIDPFYATRVVVLAKASGIAGALLVGAALGVLIFILTRTIVPGVGSILMVLAAVGGAVVLLVGGLVAEYMCSIPPEDDDKNGENGDEKPVRLRP